MTAQEPHHLTRHLKPRHIRVEHEPIDTLDLERHMTLEHLVDIRHAHHPRSILQPRQIRQKRPTLTGEAVRGLAPSRKWW